MFDLFRRKDRNLRIVLGVLLGMVALSLVITLIPGVGMPGMVSGEETVATVCGEPVSGREVRLKLQQMLNRTQLPPDQAAIFIPQFIDQLVSVKAVACQGQEMGLVATDEAVAKKIQKDVPQLWQNGKFIGKEQYENVLRASGISVKEFEDGMRKEIATTKLRSLLVMSAVAMPAEVEKAFRDAEDGVQLEYTVIDPIVVARTTIPSEAEIKAYFDKNGAQFKLPEYRKIKLVVLDPLKFGQSIEVSEQAAQRYYNENLDSFRVPERAHVRHILFKTQEKAASEDAKMKALAEDVMKQIKAGAKFADMAKKYSEDPGSKDTGGEYPNIVRGQTVKNFEDTSFNAPLKTLVGPVKTEFGYHIMEVLERQNAKLLTFAEARQQVVNEIRQSTGADAMGRAADQLRREMEKSLTGYEAAAAKAGGTIYSIEYKDGQIPLPELGPKPEVFDRVRNLKKGQVTEPLTLDNRMVLAQVEEVVPPSPMPFAEARQRVLSQLQTDAAVKKVEVLRKQAEQLVKGGATDIAKIAKEVGADVKKTQLFARAGFADGIGPASAVEEGFSKPVGHTWGPFTVDGKWFVAKVVDKKAADLSQLPARQSELINLVKNRKAGERSDIFEDRLMKAMMDKGKIKINEAAKKRLASNGA